MPSIHKLTFVKQVKPMKNVLAHARKVLSTVLLTTNTPPGLSQQAYVQLVNEGQHFAPTPYLHMQTVKQLAAECHATIKDHLHRAPSFRIEEDAWRGDGRKFSAVTAGMPILQCRCTSVCVHSMRLHKSTW